MSDNRLKRWLRGTGHLSEEDLLLYLDGELSSRRARKVSQQIRSCWQCRAQAEKTRQAITRFVDGRNARVRVTPPPGKWAGFEARLRAAAMEEPPVHRSWRDLLGAGTLLRFAAVAATVAVVLIWMHGGFAPALSATEVLRRAEFAETQASLRTPEAVVYQKVQIRRASGAGVRSAIVEAWSAPDAGRGKPPEGELWTDLQSVLSKNRMEGRSLLSPSACNAWRARLRGRSDAVTSGKLADGTDVVSVRTISKDVPVVDAILEVGTVFRTSDWHPVEQRLRVQGQNGIREFSLSEVAFQVVARNTLVRPLGGSPNRPMLPAVPSPRPLSSIPQTPAPAVSQADETELLALVVLHRAGACMGEPIEIVRRDGDVVVRGVAQTSRRRAEIVAALQSVPSLRIAVETVDEVLDKSAPASGSATNADVPARELHGGQLPVEERLSARLSQQETIALANRLVELSNEWLAHAWALYRLEQAWPSTRIARLRAPSRWLLEGVVRDHTLALRERVASCRTALDPFALPAGPDTVAEPMTEAVWPGEAREILERAREAHRLTYLLFTAQGPMDEPVDGVLARLAASLLDSEARSRRLEGEVTRLIGPNREIGSTAVR